METFQAAFPDVETVGDANKSLSWGSLLDAIEKLKKQHVETSSKSPMHRPKKAFHRVCNAINDHSNVLKMLPQSEQYTSVITGSLETITKVSSSIFR